MKGKTMEKLYTEIQEEIRISCHSDGYYPTQKELDMMTEAKIAKEMRLAAARNRLIEEPKQ